MTVLNLILIILFLLTSVDGKNRSLKKKGKKGEARSSAPIITFPVTAPVEVTATAQERSQDTSNAPAATATTSPVDPVRFGGIVWPPGFWEPYAYTGPPVPTVIFTVPPTIDPAMTGGPTSDFISEAPISMPSPAAPAISPQSSSSPDVEQQQQQQQLYQKSFTADPILLLLKGDIDLTIAQSPLYKTLEDGIGPYLTTEIGPALLQDYELAVSFDYLSSSNSSRSGSSSTTSNANGGRRELVVERWVKADIVVLLSLENTNVSLVEEVTQNEINLQVQSYFQGTKLEHLRMTMIEAGVDVTAISVKSSEQAQVDGAQEGPQNDMGTGRSRKAWMIVGVVVGVILILGSISAGFALYIHQRTDRKKNSNVRSSNIKHNKFDAKSLSSLPSLTLSPAKTPRFRDFSTRDASAPGVGESKGVEQGSSCGDVVLDFVGSGERDDDDIGTGRSSDELDHSHCTPNTMEEDERLGHQLERNSQPRLLARTPNTPTTESSSPVRWTSLQYSNPATSASSSSSPLPSFPRQRSILKKSPDTRPLIVLDSDGPMIILRDDGSLADSTLCDPNEQDNNDNHTDNRGGKRTIVHRRQQSKNGNNNNSNNNTGGGGWRSLFSWKRRQQSQGGSSSSPVYYYYSANQSIESEGTSLKTLRDVFLKPDEDIH